MLPIEAFGVILLGLAASFIGSMLGLGGGMIIIPLLTVFFGIPIHEAIGASLVSVITTSTVTGSTEARADLTNLRLAMFLEIATTAGAILGAFLSLMLGLKALAAIMFVVLAASAIRTLRPDPGTPRHLSDTRTHPTSTERMQEDGVAKRLRLSGEYYDESLDRVVSYHVSKTPIGLALSGLAGAVSGLLGIGGGIIKVPAMSSVMHVPIKVASATSNLMIGVTACASASVFYMHGSIDALLTALLMLGVVPGSAIGSRLARKAPRMLLRVMLSIVLVGAAILMLMKAFGVTS
jgi:uncharacterized membrane protein YfcA